jgi:hypothetical protein
MQSVFIMDRDAERFSKHIDKTTVKKEPFETEFQPSTPMLRKQNRSFPVTTKLHPLDAIHLCRTSWEKRCGGGGGLIWP